jgi:WD40 repeat protein
MKYNSMKWVQLFGTLVLFMFSIFQDIKAQEDKTKTGDKGAITPPSVAPPPTKTVSEPQSFSPSKVEIKERVAKPKTLPSETNDSEDANRQANIEIEQDDVNITEIVVQIGHLKQINSVAFSADSRFILSGSRDATMKLWDAETGREIRSFKKVDNEVNSIAVSPDGMYVLTGDAGREQNVRLWEIATGKLKRSFIGMGNRVNSVAISPDGQLVIACAEKQIKVWNFCTGDEVYTLDGHSGDVKSLAISNNSKFLISGGDDKLIKVWDLTSGKNVRTFTGHTDIISSLGLSPDGTFLISVSPNDLARMWDLASGDQSQTFDCSGAIDLAISPDGKNVAFGGVETIQIWDIVKGEKLKDLKGHKEGWVRTLAYSHDGLNLVSGGDDRSIKLWSNTSTDPNWSAGGSAQQINSMALSTLGDKLVVGNESGALNVWDLSDGLQTSSINSMMGIQSVAINNDGNNIFSGGWDLKEHSACCKQWDPVTGKLLTTYKSVGDVWVKTVAVNEEEKRIIWNTGTDLFLSDILTGLNLKSIKDLHQFEIKQISSYGKYALSVDDNLSQLWNIESGAIMNTFEGYRGVFARDGKNVLLVGISEETGKPKVLLWDIALNQEISNPSTEANRNSRTLAYFISSVALSPDHKQAIWSVNNDLHLWNIEKGKEIFSFTGHTNHVAACGFFADGKFAYSGSMDGSVRLWNIATGREMAKLYSFSDGEWAILTAENYFNTSANGANYLCVRQGDNVYDINSVQSTFKKPAIVGNTLQGVENLIDQKLTDLLSQYNPEPTSSPAGAPHFGLGLIEIFIILLVFIGVLVFFYLRRR